MRPGDGTSSFSIAVAQETPPRWPSNRLFCSNGGGAPDALRQVLEQAYISSTNEPGAPDRMIGAEAIYDYPADRLERLSKVLDVIIEERVSQGKAKKDIVVCVAAHGAYTQTLRILLKKGVTVVSRETSDKQYFSIKMHSKHIKDTEFLSALEENRLILSPYDEKDHEMEYDVIIWEHPTQKDGNRTWEQH